MTMAASREEVVTRISSILEEAKYGQISEDQLKKCLKLTTELNHSSKIGYRILNCLVFQIYPIMFLLALLGYPLVTLLQGSPCLITEITPLGEAMIPVMNCRVCEGVEGALRFINLSREDFIHQHAYSAKPIVVEGAARGWPAMEVFSYDYFKDLYLQTPGSLDDDYTKGQFFSYSSSIMDLKGLFQLPVEQAEMKTERWYIGWEVCFPCKDIRGLYPGISLERGKRARSTSDPNIGEELQRHIEAPYFIPPGLSHLDLSWIFMGAPGPGASIHIDMVELPSWQAQLSGTKTWTLTPPPECEHVCKPFNVTVNRGDIIVLDTNKWYHQTDIHPGNISITIGSEYH